MKDTFIDPLLHPFATSPVSSTPNLEYEEFPRSETPLESAEYLPPIAARFMSPTPFRPETPTNPPDSGSASIRRADKDTPNIDGESLDTDEEYEGDDQIGKGYPSSTRGPSQASKHNHPRSPYRATATRVKPSVAVPFPSRSHHSLPPPPRADLGSVSTHSLGRQSVILERDRERERNHSQGQTSLTDRKATPTPGSRMLRKFRKSQTTSDSIFGSAVAPHQLPEDLRICLEVVDSGVLEGHRRLSDALRKRYDEQYPLVRSLADVFVSNVGVSCS